MDIVERLVVVVAVAACLMLDGVCGVEPIDSRTGAVTVEYCDWESFNATCKADEVIIIDSAKYGRMRKGKCVVRDYGNIGCGTDVTSDFEEWCSGRSHCLVTVISLHSRQTCPTDFKSYLEAAYHCQKVSRPANTTCPDSGVVTVAAENGHLASITSAETGLGTQACPWFIQVKPYQRINVTVVDYTVPARREWHTGYSSWDHYSPPNTGEHCADDEVLGVISETFVVTNVTNTTRNLTFCLSGQRDSAVYSSEGSTIVIALDADRKLKSHFLLKVEAIGCPPLDPPPKAWMKSIGEHAVIRCNETEEAWYLTCRGTEWIGQVGNCSEPVLPETAEEWEVTDVFGTVTDFPFGILIVVALGVAIGVAIGVMMLVVVLAYMRRRRMRKVRSRSNYILKQVAGMEDPAKPNMDGTIDRAPMLLRREPVSQQGTISREYLSWQRRRPLPIPKPLEDSAERDTETMILTPDNLSAPDSLPTPDLPPPSPIEEEGDEEVSPSRFSTFRPSQRLESDSRYTPKNAYIVDSGSVPMEGPYYFKLDPTIGRNGHHMCKPDVVQGCSICQAVGTTGARPIES